MMVVKPNLTTEEDKYLREFLESFEETINYIDELKEECSNHCESDPEDYRYDLD